MDQLTGKRTLILGGDPEAKFKTPIDEAFEEQNFH